MIVGRVKFQDLLGQEGRKYDKWLNNQEEGYYLTYKSNMYADAFDYSIERKIPDIRKEVFANNSKYKELLDNQEIYGFNEFIYNGNTTIEDALKDVNISTFSSMYEYFALGENIGTCGRSSTLIGVMFDDVNYCKGINSSFIGTPTKCI